MNKTRREMIVISIISIIFAFFLISPILSTVPQTPPHTINMLVGHYFEDYYEYLSFIKQGQMGHLFVQNLFTNDDFHTYFAPWWPYAFLGFLTYLVQIPIPVHILYWITSFVLLTVLIVLVYKTIQTFMPYESFPTRLYAFLLAILACDFFSISFGKSIQIIPTDYWYSLASPFSRFGTATPHHEVIQISLLLSLLTLIKYYKEHKWIRMYIGFFLSSVVLLFLSPPQYILFLGATLISIGLETSFKIKSVFSLKGFTTILLKIYPFLLMTLLLVPFIFFLWQTSTHGPTYVSTQIWEKQNMYYPPLGLFMRASGFLLVFTCIGLYFFIRKITFEKLLILSITFLSLLFTLFPIPTASTNILTMLGFHNLRFSTPITYIFMSLVTMELLKKIFSTTTYRYILASILILYFLPSLLTRWQLRSQDPQSIGFLQFLPEDLYNGLSWVEDRNDDGAVLASAESYIGLIAPAIAGKRVYMGRNIFTLDEKTKLQQTKQLYANQLSDAEIKKFLQKENIRYVFLTYKDTDKSIFAKTYHSLRNVYHNKYLTIYSL